MLKKLLLIITFINIYFMTFSVVGSPDNSDESGDYSWIDTYINLDPSDDIYHDVRLKHYNPTEEYVENLQYNQKIDFFIDSFDVMNIRKNINILPRFPYIFLLYGGYNYNKGFDVGFLFRADNLMNTRIAFTTAASFAQNDRLWLHTNIEYPALLNGNMKIFCTMSFFTSAPQYSSRIFLYPDVMDNNDPNKKVGNYIINFFNKIWNKLDIGFNKYYDIGSYFEGGLDYRVPFLNLNIIGGAELVYLYNYFKDDTVTGNEPIRLYEGLPTQVLVNKHNFGVNLKTEFRLDRLKPTATLPVGYYFSLKTKFYLPTTIGSPNSEFAFKSRLEGKLSYKLFREFAFKFRLLVEANYNISEDFSCDPYLRGPSKGEVTGWFAILSNFELYIPIVDLGLLSGPKTEARFKRPAKFVLYLVLFADGGFSLENYNYFLENYDERPKRNNIKNSLDAKDVFGQKSIGYGNYLLPAFSMGAGLDFYPFFLHFILRVDVGVNIIKTIIYQNAAESISINVSFSQMF